MSERGPERTRVYQNHHLDSTRWDGFEIRDDDIVIATPYKSGTTWMQGIVSTLILGECDHPTSKWLDFRPLSLDEVQEQLEEQTHRRSIKTHLPLDGLPFYESVKYIVVSRDPRDVFMSLWNHYKSYTDAGYTRFNDWPGRVGSPQPKCPENIRVFWQMWITQGWFEWDNEGYPFWSNMRHVQTWWDHGDQPNILFVHYNHLKADPSGQVQRIADYLGIAVTDEIVDHVVRSTTIDAMRDQDLERERNRGFDGGEFEKGSLSFYYKGTNNRWKDVLTEEDLVLYEAAAERNLSTSCRAWLEE
jgi:aryl sulfotransferase